MGGEEAGAARGDEQLAALRVSNRGRIGATGRGRRGQVDQRDLDLGAGVAQAQGVAEQVVEEGGREARVDDDLAVVAGAREVERQRDAPLPGVWREAGDQIAGELARGHGAKVAGPGFETQLEEQEVVLDPCHRALGLLPEQAEQRVTFALWHLGLVQQHRHQPAQRGERRAHVVAERGEESQIARPLELEAALVAQAHEQASSLLAGRERRELAHGEGHRRAPGPERTAGRLVGLEEGRHLGQDLAQRLALERLAGRAQHLGRPRAAQRDAAIRPRHQVPLAGRVEGQVFAQRHHDARQLVRHPARDEGERLIGRRPALERHRQRPMAMVAGHRRGVRQVETRDGGALSRIGLGLYDAICRLVARREE